MKMYLLSDNIDTLRGMRLAGVEGDLVHEREETQKALSDVFSNTDIGVLLVTQKLFADFGDLFAEAKLSAKTPLIVEIPDRHGTLGSNSIANYIKDAVGISI